MLHQQLVTLDNYHINTWVFNRKDFSTHVFVANRPDETIDSTNHTLFPLRGKDAYECLISEGRMMTRQEIIRSFFSKQL